MNVIHSSNNPKILKKNHFSRTLYKRPTWKRICGSALTASFIKHKSTNGVLEADSTKGNCQEQWRVEYSEMEEKVKKKTLGYFQLARNSRMACYNVSYSVICCDVFILAAVNVIRCRYVLGKMPDAVVVGLDLFLVATARGILEARRVISFPSQDLE